MSIDPITLNFEFSVHHYSFVFFLFLIVRSLSYLIFLVQKRYALGENRLFCSHTRKNVGV